MHLRHFFGGMLDREELASAFLATMLDGDSDFRREFLAAIEVDAQLVTTETLVEVERDAVDITLSIASTIVLIENKVNSGSVQAGQLVRYYRAAVDRAPEKRIVAVFIAPGGGQSQAKDVQRDATFMSRGTDHVHVLTWDDVWALMERVPGSQNNWFARSGKEAIQDVIGRSQVGLFEPSGDRAAVRAAIDEARRLLSARAPERLGQWPSRNVELVLTYGAFVTAQLGFYFATEPEPPFAPVGVRLPDGRLHLRMGSHFKLSSSGRKHREILDRWTALLRQGVVELREDRYERDAKDWFNCERNVDGSESELAVLMAGVGARVLDFLRPLNDMNS